MIPHLHLFNMCARMVEDLVRQLTGGLPPIASPPSVLRSSLSPVSHQTPGISEVTSFSVLPGYQPPLATPATTPLLSDQYESLLSSTIPTDSTCSNWWIKAISTCP